LCAAQNPPGIPQWKLHRIQATRRNILNCSRQ
jgi:hypothetical protein